MEMDFDILDYMDFGKDLRPMPLNTSYNNNFNATIGAPIEGRYGSSSRMPGTGDGFGLALPLGLAAGTALASGSLLASDDNTNRTNAEQRSLSRMSQRGVGGPQPDFYGKLFPGSDNALAGLFRPKVKEKLGIESKNTGSPFKGTAPPISKTTTEAGPNFDLTDIDQLMKPDVPPKTFKQKIGGVLNNVMDAINNPAENEQFYRGLRAYIDGKNGLTIGETLLKESKLSKEQYKTMFDNAYKLSQIRKNNAYADAQDAKALGTGNVTPGAKLAAGLTYGQGLIPQIENRITAEYFPGVDKDTIPARQISSLASMLTQDVNEMVTSGIGLNEAIDRAMGKAENQGALSKGKIQERRFMLDKKIPASADASKYTQQRKSLKVLMANPKNKDYTEEEIRTYVNSLPNTILVD
jgi:hypothetical protein